MASGRLVVTWSDAPPGAAQDDPWFRLVRGNGTLFGGPEQMNTTPGTHATQTQVVALPGGGFLAIWTESVGATGAVGVGDARIVGRVYDNAGVAVTGEITVSNGTTGLRYDPAVTLGGDGHVYVGWREEVPNGEAYVMRALDETGALLGEEFYLSDMVPVASYNRFIDLATLDNGDVVATWQSWFGTSDIVTRLIHADREDARVSGGADVVALAAGGDLLDALAGADAITGGTGADTVFGNGGTDTLTGAEGRDFLVGGSGADSLEGGVREDTLMGGAGADVMTGDGGDDVLIGEDQADTMTGGEGNDTIQGGAGSDVLSGNAGNDSLWGDHDPSGVWTDGTGQADTLYGGEGDDKLYGGAGDDVLFGDDYSYQGLETGNDRLVLSEGDDTLNGLAGQDTIDASGATLAITVELDPYSTGMGRISAVGGVYSGTIYQAEHVWGGAFDDTLRGNAAENGLTGNGGNDLLEGAEGADTLLGNGGADVILGENGQDLLEGGNAGDSLYGGANDDTLDGGTGGDSLEGGSGADRIVFALGYGRDTVTGHVQGQDEVSLDAALWGGGLTAAEVVASFATLSTNGRKVTLDFGAGDVLVLKGAGFDLATLADDLLI